MSHYSLTLIDRLTVRCTASEHEQPGQHMALRSQRRGHSLSLLHTSAAVDIQHCSQTCRERGGDRQRGERERVRERESLVLLV